MNALVHGFVPFLLAFYFQKLHQWANRNTLENIGADKKKLQ